MSDVETIDLREAEINLSELIERAAAGEEFIIARAGLPRARLVPLAQRREPRPLGLFKGQITIQDDFDAPLPDAFALSFGGREQ